MSMHVLACGLVLAAGLAVAAAQTPPSTASGALTINGKKTALRYAYAFREELSTPEIVVLLTDAPLSVLDVQDVFAIHDLARESKLRAVEVRFLLDGTIRSGSLYDVAVGEAHVTRTGYDVFEKKSFDARHIEGRLFMKKPSKAEDLVYDYSASFSAEISGTPKPTAEGAAAAATGPGKASLAYVRALLGKDRAGLKATLAPSLLAMFNASGDLFFEGASDEFSPNTKVLRVFEYGSKAIAETDGRNPDGGNWNLKLVSLDGVWKVNGLF